MTPDLGRHRYEYPAYMNDKIDTALQVQNFNSSQVCSLQCIMQETWHCNSNTYTDASNVSS